MSTESISKKELFSYMFFCLGVSTFFYLTSNFVSIYLTDLGIAAGSVALITALAQIWDAVNDPIFGTIVDKKPFGKGKYLPWTKFASISMPLVAIFLFLIPDTLSGIQKFSWALAGYVLYRTFFTTADISQFGIVTVMTESVQERNVINSIRNIGGVLAVTLVSVLTPAIFTSLGWGATGIIMAALGFILMFPFHKIFRERIQNKSADGITLKSMFSALLQNRFLLIFYISVVISQATNSVLLIIPYFSRYCLGSDGYSTLLFLLILAPTFVIALLLPKLTAVVDKFILLCIGLVGSAITGVIHYFLGYDNFSLFIVMLLIRGIFLGSQAMIMFIFTADIVEYGHFATGRRVEALCFSVQTFSAKMTAAICSALSLLILSAAGFVSGLNAEQSMPVLETIWRLFTLFPAAGAIISLIPFSMYRLRDHDVQIMTLVNNNEISYSVAVSKLRKVKLTPKNPAYVNIAESSNMV